MEYKYKCLDFSPYLVPILSLGYVPIYFTVKYRIVEILL